MYKLFPLTLTHDGRKVPVKDFEWQVNCTDDQNTINSWSSIYPQLKFYGVPTGSINGLLVLDVDVKDGGLETIKKYHVPLTKSQTTLSGGKHYIFKYPLNGLNYGNRVKFDEGLDIRGEGGYIAYYGFDDVPIADAPEWLLDEALNIKKEIEGNLVKVETNIVNSILQEACDNIRNAPEGQSNDILNVESYRIGQLLPSGSIDEEYAFNELFQAAKERGKPDYEAKATIKSGFKGGSKAPWTCPFDDVAPTLQMEVAEQKVEERWTPKFYTKYDLKNLSKLRKPQLFKDWSTEDIHITTADGGTGKTTLKLVEAIHLALGMDFLGFENKQQGRTLFITGEDTWEKIGAMIGAILTQMGIIDDDEKVRKVMDSIVCKKDAELCLITKTRDGFIKPNYSALESVEQAIEDIRPKMIIFDPIASFWGSESALNDMSKAVAKFLSFLVEKSDACVEAINHMGKASSKDKDMSQFAGRGGTGLPSHARVSRVLRPVFDEEYYELTGFELQDGESAMMCNINKFSDGSKLYNKPFVIKRTGYLFERVVLTEKKEKEEVQKMSDVERVFSFVKNERNNDKYPSKNVVIGHFGNSGDKLSRERVNTALNLLLYNGNGLGEKLQVIDNPDIEAGGKVLTVTDLEGKVV